MTNRAIAEFVSHLKSLDVQLFIEGEQNASLDQMRLRCTAPEGTLTNELRQELADRKVELVLYLHRLQLQPVQPTTPIQPTQGTVFPVSLLNSDYGFCINSHPTILSTMCLLLFA